jgi:hypothetical protein
MTVVLDFQTCRNRELFEEISKEDRLEKENRLLTRRAGFIDTPG